MLKKTITYEDFDENKVTDTLYFNITKTEIGENLYLIESFDNLQDMFKVKHNLSTVEITTILEFVKTLMKLSYGLKSPDGKSFEKSDELWRKFTQTAAYDAFTFSLFENPEEANDFMIGIFPKDLLASAKLQIAASEAGNVNDTVLSPVLRPPTQDHMEKQLPVVRPPVNEKAELEARLAVLNAKTDAE
jgi:hypothetical protein